MTRSTARSALVLVILAPIAASVCAGSGSTSCTAAESVRHHRTSVVRVERCAEAGFRSMVHR